MEAVVVPIVVLVAASCAVSNEAASGEPITAAVVERIIDGDTLDLAIDGSNERVRLLGIDAPESVARNVPEQCFGQQAADALAALVPPGSTVHLSRDVEARDRYGRLLLYLHRADGLFVNRWLVQEGLADAVSYEPNTTHRPVLEGARRAAAATGTGLWGACDGPDQPLS